MTPAGLAKADREVAAAAALAGAAVVRERYGTALARVDKGAGDFATAADLAAEEAILAVLRAARPDDAVLGEESGHSGVAWASRTWLVDPLCGTLNYATGAMLVAVNVALRIGSVVTAAAVADPFSGEVFSTGGDGVGVGGGIGVGVGGGIGVGVGGGIGVGVGGGIEVGVGGRDGVGVGGGVQRAFGHGPADSNHQLAGTTGREECSPPLVDLNLDPSHDGQPADRATRLIGDPEFRRLFRPRVLSTTLALAWVAVGRRAAYVTGGDVRDNVHFAAGIALCQAAGCLVTGLDGGPWQAGPGGLVASADPGTHETLLRLLAGTPA